MHPVGWSNVPDIGMFVLRTGNLQIYCFSFFTIHIGVSSSFYISNDFILFPRSVTFNEENVKPRLIKFPVGVS